MISAALLSTLSLSLGVSSAGERGPVLVLAVGANRGLPVEAALRFADRDARRYAATLAQVSAAPMIHQEVLRNPSPVALERALERLAAAADEARRGAQVHFYYSGHGDRLSLHLGGARYPLKQLWNRLGAVAGQMRVVVIDACRSPELSEKGFARGPGFGLLTPTVAGTVVLNAASEGETAQESAELRGAVFTHALLTGLKGAADVDGDRQITLSELYRHAYRQTVLRSSMTSGTVMHPSVSLDLEGAGEVVLGRIAPESARIVFPAEQSARIVLFDRVTAAVVAEIWTDPSKSIQVAVPPGAYLVTRRNAEGAGARELVLSAGITTVESDRFQSIAPALLAEKGGHLRLRSHQVGVRLGAGYRLGTLPALGLDWTYGGTEWRGGITLRALRSSYSGAQSNFESWEGDMEFRVLRRWGRLELGAGIFGRVLNVRGETTDAAIRASLGLPATTEGTGPGLGLRLGLAWREPVHPAWSLVVSGSGAALTLQEDDRWRVRPEGLFELGLEFEP